MTTILVVDDNPDTMMLMRELLQIRGYDVVAVPDASQAEAEIRRQLPDLILSDVVMPEMTGPELVRELRARRPDIAILFVTGFVGDGESDDLVGHELLRKPFTVAALATSVADALARLPSGSRPISGAAATG